LQLERQRKRQLPHARIDFVEALHLNRVARVVRAPNQGPGFDV
jgi:hypothetical protein